MRHGERVEQHGAETFYNWAFGSISTTFTLPAKFYIDLSYNYQSASTWATAGSNPTTGCRPA